MNIRNFYIAILAGSLVTILLVFVRPYIPGDELAVSDLSAQKFVYSSADIGGGTQATLGEGTGLSMSCEIVPGTPGGEYCGLGYAFVPEGQLDGIDLSAFDEIKIKVEYSGNAREIKLYVRSFSTSLLAKDYPNPIITSSYFLRRKDLNIDLNASLERFSVAEWWLRENQVSAGDAVPDFEKVVSINVEIPYQSERSVHKVKISDITFTGERISANQLYTLLFVLWIAALSLVCVLQLISLSRRTRHDANKIHMLARSNEALENESKKYRQLSYQDALTGLLNRGGFDEQKASLLANSATETYTLIIADLDHFKKINDKYGHDVGDQVLCTVSDIIKINTRNTDLVSRWGGEEFLILCPTASLEEAIKICEKVARKISSFSIPSFPELRITASFGVGLANKKEEFSVAFKRVDEALYDAKQAGRDRIVVADMP